MSKQADEIRDRRRHFALPGGSHDLIVRVLAIALPAGIGALLAVMIVAPLFPRGDISFLLDRRKVASTTERLRVDQAMYKGRDGQGRPFTVAAGKAVQRTSQVPVVELQGISAHLQMTDGPAEMRADSGQFNIQNNVIDVNGPIDFRAADGYHLSALNVAVDLKAHRISGSSNIVGEVPSGKFTADRLEADLENRTVALKGRARLVMQGSNSPAP